MWNIDGYIYAKNNPKIRVNNDDSFIELFRVIYYAFYCPAQISVHCPARLITIYCSLSSLLLYSAFEILHFLFWANVHVELEVTKSLLRYWMYTCIRQEHQKEHFVVVGGCFWSYFEVLFRVLLFISSIILVQLRMPSGRSSTVTYAFEKSSWHKTSFTVIS